MLQFPLEYNKYKRYSKEIHENSEIVFGNARKKAGSFCKFKWKQWVQDLSQIFYLAQKVLWHMTKLNEWNILHLFEETLITQLRD